MDRGTYAAASAGLAQLRKLDIVSNNLANVATTGYKKQVLTAESQPFDMTFAQTVAKQDPYAKGDHDRSPGVVNFKEVTDFSQGSVQTTGSPLDVALNKEGDFFVIQTPEGIRYTRAGSFTLDGEGKLMTPDGMTVQGDGGEIVALGTGAVINRDGSVQANGNNVGRIQVVHFDDPQASLVPAGNSRYSLAEGAAQPQQIEADLTPGAIELANVSAVSSMVDLIAASRGFEMYTKAAQSIDEMNSQAISRYGSRR
ncbi:MAG: flagellar hook-basal body protein [SAR324 cluster bacterium]|uniref:Flagellar hook-basal body protein n=1 Tax=SAR324 cluster bacterium TaxID=2024889 RepID=A0A7X9FPG7_9DELT|nr:flagellar hook-basal body protein [SAR324 cluster bacterium]